MFMSGNSYHLISKLAVFGFVGALIAPAIQADQTDARCDIYPRGEDHASASIPCVFSQRQGYINIDRSDGITHELSPQGTVPGNFKDGKGNDAFRQSGLGEAGLIFRFSDESIYLYWDTAGLPGNSDIDNYTAPYTTKSFDATARLPCSLQGKEVTFGDADCAVGIKRGPKYGQAILTIMRSDGVERILRFDGDSVATPGKGDIHTDKPSDDWLITIDGNEVYRIPVAAIEGG